MKDIQTSLASLDLDGLRSLLWELKTYRSLSKDLWKRWQEAYERRKKYTNQYVIEYYPDVGESLALEQALWVYEKVFEEKPNKDYITLIPSVVLKWWIKVYRDDSMVDLSYARIEKQIH